MSTLLVTGRRRLGFQDGLDGESKQCDSMRWLAAGLPGKGARAPSIAGGLVGDPPVTSRV